MLKWIEETFEVLRNGYEDVEGNVSDSFIFINKEGKQTSGSVLFFVSVFGDSKPSNLKDFLNKDESDIYGWHVHFNHWKEQGLLT